MLIHFLMNYAVSRRACCSGLDCHRHQSASPAWLADVGDGCKYCIWAKQNYYCVIHDENMAQWAVSVPKYKMLISGVYTHTGVLDLTGSWVIDPPSRPWVIDPPTRPWMCDPPTQPWVCILAKIRGAICCAALDDIHILL